MIKSFKDNFKGIYFQLFAVVFVGFAVGFNVGGFTKGMELNEKAVESRIAEERAVCEKECDAKVKKDNARSVDNSLLDRCLASISETMRCDTKLKHVLLKLSECRDKVIKQSIDERGI